MHPDLKPSFALLFKGINWVAFFLRNEESVFSASMKILSISYWRYLTKTLLIFIILNIVSSLCFAENNFSPPPPPPSNDDCANAINVMVNGAIVSGVTQQATLEAGELIECAPALVTQSVWYYFTATSANISVSLNSTAGACYFSSSIWEASSGCPASTGCHPLSCQSASGGPNLTEHVLTNLTIGANYYIQILYTAGSGGCGNFAGFDISISTTLPATPSNPPPLSTCASPSGSICVLNFTPTYAQAQANCNTYVNPVSANNANEVYQACFSFTAQYSSTIDFQFASLSTCNSFNWFNWELFNSSCSSFDCGGYPDMSSTGLICGNNYELCIAFEIPSACNFTHIIPYITAIPPALTILPSAGNSLAICKGASTTLVANAIGDVSYQWSPSTALSATTGSIVTANPTITTTYTVTGFDAGGCSQTNTVVVTVRPIPIISLAATSASCGTANGFISNTTTGGGGPFSFVWSNGQLNEDLSGLLAGTYTVTATNSFGCTSSASITVNNAGNFTLSYLIMNPIFCFGQTGGPINVSIATAANPPYTYLWNTGATTQDINNILAGTYTLTATNSVGCTTSISVLLSQPPPINISLVATDVSCFGGATGMVDLTVSGGSPFYAYTWSNGATVEDIQGLLPGNYKVTVYDFSGCTAVSNTVTVNSAIPINFSQSITNASCGGANNGAVNITVSGGSTPYTFFWSNGATTEDINGLPAGPISVNIFDLNGCPYTWSGTITGGSSPVLSSVTTYTSCLGNINLSVAGGTAPYNYLWNTTATTQDISGLIAGAYSVTVTDANNCTQNLSVIIAAPSTNIVTLESVDPTCGSNDGTAEVDLITGGGGPFTYLWNTGGTDFEIDNLAAGTYSVTVTNSFGCTSTASITLISPNGPTLLFTQTNVLCNGSATGSINLTVTGGTAPFIYLWSNGSSIQDPLNLIAGTYNVTVTDANNCVVTGSIVVTQNAATVLSQASVNSTCGLGNGSVNLTVVGNGPFVYLWNNASTDQDLPFVGAGNYSVTVTDINNCTSTLSLVVNNTPGPSSLSFNPTPVLCNGAATGIIDLTVIGGTAPFTYAWNNGATTQDISGLPANTYTVNVTDANNCVVGSGIIISQPAPNVISETHVNASCGLSNGSINLSAAGPNPPFTYLWSNAAITEDINAIAAGAYTVTVTDFNNCTSTLTTNISNTSGPTLSETHVNVLCNGNNTGSINLAVVGGTAPYGYLWSNASIIQDPLNLIAGNYTVTVTDFNNCQSTLTIAITEPTAIALSETHADASCGTANGSINLSVVGGTIPYTFVWSNAAITEDINAIAAGAYTVTVTDFNNCTSALTINIQNGNGPNLSETHVNSTCGNANGSINLSVVGGQNPYSYIWSNGSVFQDLVFLNGGNYSVTVTDNNNCTSTISISISGSTALVLQTIVTEVTCFGFNDGAIDLTVNGGIAPYAYHWNNNANTEDLSGIAGGNYDVTVTDFSGCTAGVTVNVVEHAQLTPSQTHVNETCGQSNGSIILNVFGGYIPYTFLWSNNAVTQNINGIAAGNYTVTVTDFNLCTAVLTVIVTGTSGPTTQFVSTDLLCNGNANGAINLTVVGGTQPYTYLWSNAAITQDINNLSSGNYSVTMTDANNCTGSGTATVIEPAIIQLTEAHVDASCGNTNGSIDLSVSGGTSPYNYAWNNAAVTQDLTSLGIGTYDVTVSDFNNCTSAISINIINGGGSLSLSYTSTDETCSGGNGSINLSVNTGTVPYSFIWSNTAITEDINLLSAATYDVTVNDAGGCSGTASIIIANSPSPQLSETHVDETCGNANGSVDLTVAGGTLPLNYLWSNASINEDITTLVANNFTVTVTDANNCTATISVQILNTSGPVINENHTDENCNQVNGSIDLTINSGVSPYNFIWSNSAITQDLSNLSVGNYSVTVTDVNGCSTSQSVLINNIAGPQLSETHVSTSCGLNNGSINLTVAGGVLPFNYLWSNNALTQDLQNLAANTFDVTVTDGGGCTAVLSGIVINTSTSPQASETHTSSTCGNANAGIDITASNGISPYNYLWNNNSVTEDLTSILSGNYTVTVTDNAGCTTSLTISVNDIAGPQLVILPTATSCGNTDGTIDLTVNGGTASFNYSWSNGTVTEDLAALSGGNYVVTVTDANGCSATINTDVIASTYPIISANISGNNGCIPLTVLFTNTSTNAATYNWIFGDGSTSSAVSPTHQYNQVGNFPVLLIATSATGCTDTLAMDTVSIYETPIADFISVPWINETTLLSLAQFQFTNQSVFASTYLWNFGDGNNSNEINPAYTYTSAGDFYVTLFAFNNNGCADTITYGPFILLADGDVFIPNTFTPNNDHMNDVFQVFGTGITSIHMWIYDRWGEMLYEENTHSPAWNGIYHNVDLNVGVYVYQLEITRYDGTIIWKKGDVTLLR